MLSVACFFAKESRFQNGKTLILLFFSSSVQLYFGIIKPSYYEIGFGGR